MIHSNFMMWTISIVGGFLSGTIMYCWIIPKMILNKDICVLSTDHNPGAANVFKTCGVSWGLLCLFLDMLKGYLPVRIACQYLDIKNLWFSVVLAAPVLGHAVGSFHHCRGGKCIATAFGSTLGLIFVEPIVILLAILYILFSTLIKIEPHRVRSILTFGLFGILSFFILSYKNEDSIAVGCALISLIAICKHTKHFSEC